MMQAPKTLAGRATNAALIRLSFILIVFLQGPCGYAQPPKWLNEDYRKLTYPAEEYLSGFSYSVNNNSETKENLLKRMAGYAKNELLESIRVTLQSNSTLSSKSTQTSFTQQYTQAIITHSDGFLFGMVTELYYDENKHTGYAFVFVNRGELISRLSASLNEKYDAARLTSTSQPHTTLPATLGALLKAYHLLEQAGEERSFLTAVAGPQPAGTGIAEITTLQQQVLAQLGLLLGKLHFNTQILPKPEITGNRICVRITAKVVSEKKELAGFPLFFYPPGNKAAGCRVFTDSAGVASGLIHYTALRNSNKSCVVEPDLASLLGADSVSPAQAITNLMPHTEAFAPFKNLTLQVKQDATCLPVAETQLRETLLKNGFELATRVPDSTAIARLELSCNSYMGAEMEGVHFAFAEINYTLTDIAGEKVIAAGQITKSKGGGLNQQMAVQRAYDAAAQKLDQELTRKLAY